MTIVKEKNPTLTKSDRCDRCGSQAWVVVKGLSGELYFCSHHFNEHESKLIEWSYEVIDDRKFLV